MYLYYLFKYLVSKEYLFNSVSSCLTFKLVQKGSLRIVADPRTLATLILLLRTANLKHMYDLLFASFSYKTEAEVRVLWGANRHQQVPPWRQKVPSSAPQQTLSWVLNINIRSQRLTGRSGCVQEFFEVSLSLHCRASSSSLTSSGVQSLVMKILPNLLKTRQFGHILPPTDWELYDLRCLSGPSKLLQLVLMLQLILKVLLIDSSLIFLHLTNLKLLPVPSPGGLFFLLQSISQLDL